MSSIMRARYLLSAIIIEDSGAFEGNLDRKEVVAQGYASAARTGVDNDRRTGLIRQGGGR